MDPQQRREYNQRYYLAREAELFAFLGGVCARCGGTDRLEVDHIDRTQKSFDLKAKWTKNPSPKLLAEAAKCQLLCHDDHLRKSIECGDIGPRTEAAHGGEWRYRVYGCRCEECVAGYRRLRRSYPSRRAAERGRYGRPSDHGDWIHYKRGCRCTLCRAANAQKTRDRKNQASSAGHDSPS